MHGEDTRENFTPSYEPWTQRLCLVPDNDLFLAIRKGKADVVTGKIGRIGKNGVMMEDGELVEADVLVTATGLNLQVLGGVRLFRDGEEFDPANSFNYHGMMFSGLPNLVYTFGYVNASWTLRADLNSRYFCKLLKPWSEGRTPMQPGWARTKWARNSTIDANPATCSAPCTFQNRKTAHPGATPRTTCWTANSSSKARSKALAKS